MHYPVWVNGSKHERVDPEDRGLAYGDGLFETVRVEAGRAVLLDQHFSRLETDAATLGIALEMTSLKREFHDFIAACPVSCIAKIIVTRGSSGRGYLPVPDAVPTRILIASGTPTWPSAHSDSGIDAVVCSFNLAIQPALAGLKHLNRLEQVLLRHEIAEKGSAEGLVCDLQGRVIEGVFSNLFMVRHGRLETPAISGAGIRGVMRASIMQQAGSEGVPVIEGDYGVEDFLAAEEIFFCNSVYGLWPVRSLLGRHWSPGPVTRRWQAFWQQQLG
jgi:4-amino-4-deoxychorismate lyase